MDTLCGLGQAIPLSLGVLIHKVGVIIIIVPAMLQRLSKLPCKVLRTKGGAVYQIQVLPQWGSWPAPGMGLEPGQSPALALDQVRISDASPQPLRDPF